MGLADETKMAHSINTWNSFSRKNAIHVVICDYMVIILRFLEGSPLIFKQQDIKQKYNLSTKLLDPNEKKVFLFLVFNFADVILFIASYC